MADKEISPRHEIANEISQFIVDNKLTNPYGGTVHLATLNKKKYYSIGFSYPKAIDGEVAVYSPNFIQVTYKFGRRADNPVFESKADTLKFLKFAFIDIDWEKAEKVARKK